MVVIMDVALSKGKLEKALHYKGLLDKVEEAKKRHEKMKFAEECEVSITTLNRLRHRYEKEGFLGLIDKRDGNPDRNKEVGDRVREKFLETGLNGKKLRNVLIEDGVPPNKIYSERHIYRLVATYKKELAQAGVDVLKKRLMIATISP
jgi:transposase